MEVKELNLGDTFYISFSFSQEDVNKFAELIGDKNRIHIDPAYASTTMFGKPIMHGFLTSSIFSRGIGMAFPGEGTLYLKQDLKFLGPAFVDTTYYAEFEVIEIQPKHRALIRTEVKDNNGTLIVSGEALVSNKDKIKSVD